MTVSAQTTKTFLGSDTHCNTAFIEGLVSCIQILYNCHF